jgi:hypothetical protein
MAGKAAMPAQEEEAVMAQQWLLARAAQAAMAVMAAQAAQATQAELPRKTPALYRASQLPVMLLLLAALLVMPVTAARAAPAEAA